MALDYPLFHQLQHARPDEAWQAIFEHAWRVCSEKLPDSAPGAEVVRRDQVLADIDLLLATSAWDLWRSYEEVVPLTSERLCKWWRETDTGKAVLILDALSLREAPWLLSEAESRGFTVREATATAAEIPADTTPFAKALGFSQRSALSNNQAGGAHCLPAARTETSDIAWSDCSTLVEAEPNLVFWHHWPDHRLHEHDAPGCGLPSLAKEAQKHLSSDSFWEFIKSLATGRRLVITADHGYAASGNFPDSDQEQTKYLRETFKSGRWNSRATEAGAWVPPIDLLLESRHGKHLFVNGRRKWKNAGGYPTLTHGGLSVLEVAVPWIELARQ